MNKREKLNQYLATGGWRPIEEAPQDGRVFLVSNCDEHPDVICMAHRTLEAKIGGADNAEQ